MMQSVLFCLILTITCPASKAYNHISRRSLLEGAVEVQSEDEQPEILAPRHLPPGDLATVVNRRSGKRIDPETLLIGLPPNVTQLWLEFFESSGMSEVAHELLYERPVKKRENRVYALKDGSSWAARTSANWVKDGDMTWIDPANEASYEKAVDIWRQAGFDVVLDTLGEKFGMDGVWIDGTSFIIVSHFEGYNIHTDIDGLGSKVFNIIFPLIIPEKGGQLLVSKRERRKKVTGINFQPNVGVLVGGDSPHGTGNCDYRETQEYRLAIAVYLTDINEENIDELADDDTAFFPPNGDKRWIMAQAGRHWPSRLSEDKGRQPIQVQDKSDYDCQEMVKDGVSCDKSMKVRNACLKTCQVYLEDQTYYEMLGKLLDWPTESIPNDSIEQNR